METLVKLETKMTRAQLYALRAALKFASQSPQITKEERSAALLTLTEVDETIALTALYDSIEQEDDEFADIPF